MTVLKQEKKTNYLSVHDPGIPKEIFEMVIDQIINCPFRITDQIDLKNIPVNVKEEKNGWYFHCRLCQPNCCSGFIQESR